MDNGFNAMIKNISVVIYEPKYAKMTDTATLY